VSGAGDEERCRILEGSISPFSSFASIGDESGVGKTRLNSACECRKEGAGVSAVGGSTARGFASGTLNPRCFSGRVCEGVRVVYVPKGRRIPRAGGCDEV